MRFSLVLISLVSFAGLASAQTGYGRFPCSSESRSHFLRQPRFVDEIASLSLSLSLSLAVVNGDGTFSPGTLSPLLSLYQASELTTRFPP